MKIDLYLLYDTLLDVSGKEALQNFEHLVTEVIIPDLDLKCFQRSDITIFLMRHPVLLYFLIRCLILIFR